MVVVRICHEKSNFCSIYFFAMLFNYKLYRKIQATTFIQQLIIYIPKLNLELLVQNKYYYGIIVWNALLGKFPSMQEENGF